jgi:hypothetical protein
MVIGINYMINNQNPQCGDYSALDQNLKNNFETLLPNLCDCDYKYYSNQGLRPTSSFYTLDIIGELKENEPFYNNLIRKALLNAWSKQYAGLSDISIPLLSNKFIQRVGSLGTLISRVYYTIFIDGYQVLNNIQVAPSNASIQFEFEQLGYDFRTYSSCNSIMKSLLLSVYINEYPLKPSDRPMIENNIKLSLLRRSFIQPYELVTVTVLYSELYQSQYFGYKVSRVYYSVIIFNLLFKFIFILLLNLIF